MSDRQPAELDEVAFEQLLRRLSKVERVLPSAIDNHEHDRRWNCARCEQLLGLIDKQTGRIRMQVREFNVDFLPAPDEAAKTRCKRCGWLNEYYSNV